MADLEGKVAIITGASSGLGRVFSTALAKHGCNVILSARRMQLLQSLSDEINSLSKEFQDNSSGSDGASTARPGKAAIIELDVSANEAAIEVSVEKAWAVFGQIDILVNNAGFRGSVKSPLDLEEAEWNSVMATNLRGSWLMAKAVGRRWRAGKRGGSIINISSISGLERSLLPGALAYGISKAGVIHMTKTLALELGKFNIRVNAIAAGIFKSEITSDLFAKDWLNKVATKIVPLQRWGSTEPDLTSILLFLASKGSNYITGNIFVVDGGQSLPGIPIWSSL